ncbi:30S ribosome-binding factor RbfA [Oceanotoga sp. DSM 15011]|uniref:Ribosome-binding factor A n=1 Tax=Oceanotoga teriensis TaxID=515440 RepID=A0AA45C8T0_9BACT|nr:MULTISPECIES: 30S ribosome-binding factor RbfA [Oceanotoga]MDN5342044.1 ribosome-binding factor [Oceanotoga sp.]MDO7975486.1 30S ribosome-binding factor RbfA [Oceanotoga teriensis]PWJ96226.1 ribosome-binding factor A [Oceanotoga teriensis]UYP00010.1 30S ribosome-binding factor RbfA [Oceanotoga sp. DSM 15011]
MAGFKIQMLESQIMKLLNSNISSLRNDKLRGQLFTINKVKLAKDKSYADIFVSTLNGNIEKILDGLNESKGYLRTLIAKNIRMYKAPELRIHKDEGIEASIRINNLLNNIEIKDENDE